MGDKLNLQLSSRIAEKELNAGDSIRLGQSWTKSSRVSDKCRIPAMKSSSLVLVAITVTSLTLHAQTAAPDAEAEAAAEATVHSFVDSWNRADGAAYGENYWPDAELVTPSGAIVDGRAAIAQWHVDLWAGIFKGSRIAAKVRSGKNPCAPMDMRAQRSHCAV